jgi:acetyltransferase-like isoleucine patch superfamily enzyme
MPFSLCRFLYAKYRAFAPISCFSSPRPDVVWGLARWRWLVEMRHTGRLVDPSVELRSSGDFRKLLILEEGVAIDKGCILHLGNDCGQEGVIQIGRGVYVGPYCQIVSSHRLEIGENSLVGGFSYLITVNHRTDMAGVPVGNQGYRGADIKIGKNVWIGAHVMVLPGVEIGDNAVVGAGAVVTKSVPAGETWVGVPARRKV